MAGLVCPRCHRAAQTAEAAFCAYCGAPIRLPKELPAELEALLKRIGDTQDPVEKHRLIEDGILRYPESLELAEEKLYLGRLYERSPRKVDFSVIKCYVWHMYLTPNEFDESRKDEMRREILSHPDLERCLALAEDRELYMRRYLERLAQDFISLFLKGSSRYNGSFFGIKLGGRMGKLLAEPTARIMHNIHEDSALTSQQRETMYEAFYRAFLTETGHESRWLDECLTRMELPVPAK